MRLIDADQFKAKLLSFMNRKAPTPSDTDCILDGVLNLLDEQQTETSESRVKHGHWMHGSSSENIRVTCSECGYKVNYFWDSWQDALYCPKCGAKMEDYENETD